MALLNTVRVFVLTVLVVTVRVDSLLSVEEYDAICDKVTQDPVFTDEMVVGKKWRVYYTWNQPSEYICRDITFKRAHPMCGSYIQRKCPCFQFKVSLGALETPKSQVTHKTIESVRSTMRPFLKTQPNWTDATLYMKVAPVYFRSLLIPDPIGIPGRFHEVTHFPHFLAEERKPGKKEMDVVKVAFKVIRGGKYLIYSNCAMGVTNLLYSINEDRTKPDRKEISEIAQYYDLGYGLQQCLRD